MASLEDIERKQKDLYPLIEKLQNAEGEEAVKIAKQLEAKAREIEAAATALAKAATPEGPRNVSGETTVALTSDQKERVVEKTGVGLQAVILRGPPEEWERKLPKMPKQDIEKIAYAQAAEQKMRMAKDKAVGDLLKELKSIPDPVPELKEAIDVLEKEGPEGLEKRVKKQWKEREEP